MATFEKEPRTKLNDSQKHNGLDDANLLFTERDFQRVIKLVGDAAGIALGPHKQQMVYRRLSKRVRQKGFKRFADYLDLVENDPQERQEFIDALTTNYTFFFREPHHFATLTRQLQYLKNLKRQPVKLWSAGCSTGEEPYSMAMCVVDVYGSFNTPVRILATDISSKVLGLAELGVYTQEQIENLSPQRLKRFFLKGTGQNEGYYLVRPELKAMVAFRPFNFLETNWPMHGPFDAIFCRNVMIYFEKPTQRTILEKFIRVLADDGLFYAGHSESFYHALDLLTSLGQTVYCKKGMPTPPFLEKTLTVKKHSHTP
jgi:chemotaxis protein methyltransferase CheR